MNSIARFLSSCALVAVLAGCGAQSASDASAVSKTAPATEQTLSTGISVITLSSQFGQPQSADKIAASKQAVGGYFENQSVTKETVQSSTEALQLNGSPAPVYRFYNTVSGAHFFTISNVEKNYVQATFPQFQFEGLRFFALLNTETGLSPVYRFYNNSTGTHFYTISKVEKDTVITKWPTLFTYEGIAWYASTASGTGWIPLYRFYNTNKGTHFYTTNVVERDGILATLPQFSYEGIGYYVKDTVNLDTGITANQCYDAGTNDLVSCTSPGALVLGNTQDGMIGLDVTEPSAADGKLGFSYEAVAGGCVKDKRTGLIWEVKTVDGGLRDKNKSYTNFDFTDSYQSPSNAWMYQNAVNGTSLCGYTDWRLPTSEELHGLVDYGVTNTDPKIDNTWFPNTRSGYSYNWTSSRASYNGYTNPPLDSATVFNFGTGEANPWPRGSLHGVRLVRGSLSGTFHYSTGDSEVLDSKTGLIWQRCPFPLVLSGNDCTGTLTVKTHEQALLLAKAYASSTGKAWRLPNVKEFSSIIDRAPYAANAVNTTVFPGVWANAGIFWTSTPDVNNPQNAWAYWFTPNILQSTPRNQSLGGAVEIIRLVRTSQ